VDGDGSGDGYGDGAFNVAKMIMHELDCALKLWT
jgi:hypothetical protein